MKKIIFLSTYSDQHHVQFDASIINLYREIHGWCFFYLVGNEFHLQKVYEQINDSNIILISCRCKRKSWVYFFYFWRTFYIKSYLRVDLSWTLFSPFFLLSAIFQNQIFLHEPWWHFVDKKRKIFAFINIYITRMLPSIKYIVLGFWIKNQYSKTFIYSKIAYLPHPYLLKEFSIHSSLSSSIFGFFWSQKSFHKGKDNYHLSLRIKTYIERKGWSLFKNDNIFTEPKWFYPNVKYTIISYLQNYNYICSGVFIESIAYKVPIICFKSSMSDYFFYKYWDLWFACESMSQMEEVIDRIILWLDKNQYLIFLNNIEAARKEIHNINYIKNVYISELLT